MKNKNKNSKTSGMIYLDFSKQFELDGGNLEIVCDIQAEVFVQKPIPNANSDMDYYGYTEINSLSFEVKRLWFYDQLVEEFVEEDYTRFMFNCDKDYRQGLKNDLELKVSKAVNKEIVDLTYSRSK